MPQGWPYTVGKKRKARQGKDLVGGAVKVIGHFGNKEQYNGNGEGPTVLCKMNDLGSR